MNPTVLHEACVETAAAAAAAERTGAGRIELCSRLDLSGLTPTAGAISATLAAVNVPVHAMIRPRAGDFVYDDADFERAKADLSSVRALGVQGVVVGFLTPDRRVDRERMRQVVDLARPLTVTFHRAFDEVGAPAEELLALIALGVDRVLTSGGRPTAVEGVDVIRELVSAARGRIVVMAGGGIREENWRALVAATGVREIHGSAPIDVRRQ